MTVIVCDVCRNQGDPTTRFEVTMGGETKIVDLCARDDMSIRDLFPSEKPAAPAKPDPVKFRPAEPVKAATTKAAPAKAAPAKATSRGARRIKITEPDD
ncbi:hypothetical protein ACIA8K_12575 [Catenuloplanes sp. NPDC051500]|uniref:hypothetical protein n=1 Tax=Catenuloplanes sp. NPDC051500 TaxID=3363959 RepID=UPI0037AFBF62